MRLLYLSILSIFLSIFTALVAGCASAPTVKFACDNGKPVELQFPREGVAVLIRDGEQVELEQQPSGSGFVYSNGPNTVRGKGDELILEVGPMMPIKCEARK